ncbi:hypothetical protein ACS0TY_019201 [Phlomoides rotata]
MGENEGWTEPGEPLPNGLLPGVGPVMRAINTERWMKAEKRTAELIACIQPNKLSEERRNAVADYVKRLIVKCFPCQVSTFGSVPLKTYLPDGDIDLTALCQNQNLRDTWANQVRDMLESEEKNENAEFHVKEVQYIKAEVKLIKCLVENIVVDISFNQVGGLCTLCFLDEVDILISQNHLFKRSIILIKAWCYYESRILGAHHGLISTYALETLVLYIFHLFNNSFHGPLEVLYRFLEFFSNFDWDNFCVSLWGPVPISSLPDVTAEPPRKDSGELLLSKLFLDACSLAYSVFPGGQENNGQQFVSKHFNVIDPLRVSNNLGRSVSKGNFYRIRSAFAFGAKKLARLLDCPNENVNFEVNQFFMNTWERHGSGNRPDAPGADSWRSTLSTPDNRPNEFWNSNNVSSGKKLKENSTSYELEAEGNHTHNVSYKHGKNSSKMLPMASGLSAASLTQSLKSQLNSNSVRSSDQIVRDAVPNLAVPNEKIQRDMSAHHLVSDTQRRLLFARTRSSPELTDNHNDVPSQVQRNRHGGNADVHATYSTADSSNWGRNLGSETPVPHWSSSVEDTVARHVPSSQSLDAADSASISSGYHIDLGDALSEEFPPTPASQLMHQEEQDIVNMMASASLQGFNGQVHLPFNLSSGHIPYSIPPSFLASMGYSQQNIPGFVPTNIPFLDPSFSHVQFPHGFPQSNHYFPGVGLNPSEDSVERGNENFVRVDSGDADDDFLQELDAGSSGRYDPENGKLDTVQSDDKPPASLSGLKYVPPPSRVNVSSSASRVQQRHPREKRGAVRENIDSSSMQDFRSSEVYIEEKSGSSRLSPAAQSNSLRSRTSSESSWDGSSVKTPKSTKEKRGKKILPTDSTVGHGKGKGMSEHLSKDTDDDDQEWGSETVDRNPDSEPDFPLHVSRHHIPGFDVAQTSGSDSMMPFAPMLIGSGSGQRIAFYPTGPPIPFLTMLPVYNVPPKTGTSDASNGHLGGHETLDYSESVMNFISKGSDQSEESTSSSSLRGVSISETSEEQKADILNSDFASHLQSLQFGRVCQNPCYQGSLVYPSPVMVPPVYVQGRLPYDNPGRPLSNVFSQLVTNYGQHLVPVTAPLQSISSRHPNIYQTYVDDMPRYRSGTGTYLPNPKLSVRDRHSAGGRRGNYNHDRNDYIDDREGSWNANSKSRAAPRSHSRSQSDKSNSRTDRFAYSEGRADRLWNSHRPNSVPSYQPQNGVFRSNSNQNGPQNVAYNLHPLAAMTPNGVSNGPSAPPVLVMYPFENTATYCTHTERQADQLEFGTLGPVIFPDINELSQLNDGTRARAVEDHRFRGSSGHRSSPDQPSSPHHLRRV